MTGRERAAALGLLGLARRAGRVVLGAGAVRGALRRGEVVALVVAEDASKNALARLGSGADEVPIARLGGRVELGRALGREAIAVVGITDRGLAERIMNAKDALDAEREEVTGAETRPRRQVH